MAARVAKVLHAALVLVWWCQTSCGQQSSAYVTPPQSSEGCYPACVRGVCRQAVNSATLYCDCKGTGYAGETCNAPQSTGSGSSSAGPASASGQASACSPACQNGGICRQDINTAVYYCDCSRTAFKGASCSAGSLGPSTSPANTPACAPPCLHGGVCRQEVNSQAYYCDCSETGYDGANCSGQKALPSSASAPAASASACSPACQHGGLCKQEINSGAYFCSCAGTGYKGATCSALLTAYSPSVNSSKAASACSPPCQHGSACRQAVNSGAFYCDCEGMAFAGQDCSLPLG